jgi:glycosyltransferase involved in cell wall biosynthesis
MERLKICQITPYYHPSIGGVEEVARYLSEELVRRGHEVHVFTAKRLHKGRPPLPLPRRETLNGVAIRRFSSLVNLGHMSMCPGMVPALIGGRFDVMHVHNYRHPHSEVVSVAGKACRALTVLHGHGPFFRAESAGSRKAALYGWYDRSARSGILKRIDWVIALNRSERDHYIRLGAAPSKIEIIYNAAEDACFGVADPAPFIAKHGLKGRRVVLFIGILNRYKRPDLAVHAISRVIPTHPDVCLVLAGPDGGLLGAVREAADRLGIAEHVRYVGPLYGDEKHQAYACAEITLLPSDEDPYPLVILEAMAHGRPVIGSDAVGPREMILHGETGFIVPRGNSEAIAASAMRLLGDAKLRLAMGNHAREVAARKHSVGGAVDRLEALYRTSLRGRLQ